jgi:Xaa-Pro aminopeptidase
MRSARIAWVILASSFLAYSSVTLDEHRARRAELRKRLEGVAVVFGATTLQRDGFRQESSFFYLTGWNEPGAALILTPGDEWLVLPDRNPARDLIDGRRSGADDPGIQARTGFEKVLPRSGMMTLLNRLLEEGPRVYFLPNQAEAEQIRPLTRFKEETSLLPLIAQQRMRKSAREIQLMQAAANLTLAAHQASWSRVGAGLFEYQMAATLSKGYLDAGCERHAYAPTVGSGENSTIPHYKQNRRRFDHGDLVLVDMGGECSGYAADITRTIPVSGTFTPRQRELYEAVLAAQRAAIAAVRPGITMNELDRIARAELDARGPGGVRLSAFMVHYIGHHIGLDVHDPADYSVPLEPGMVITIEPGIYLPGERIGIRIEDVVVVTSNGARVLSDALPKDPDELERLVGKN